MKKERLDLRRGNTYFIPRNNTPNVSVDERKLRSARMNNHFRAEQPGNFKRLYFSQIKFRVGKISSVDQPFCLEPLFG